ncbi:MAG: hypothetical protein U0J08_07050, partial [Agathobaculum butyriciproducens]|nr:hypothetical protein [Agathobaculum butyriciproducens]
MENEYRIKPFAEWFAGCGWKRKRAVNHMKIHGSFVREHIETPSDNDKRCRRLRTDETAHE